MLIGDLLSRLDRVRETRNGWVSRCPGHKDSTPSLSIAVKGDKILLKCFANCGTEIIVEALGLTLSDLSITAGREKQKGSPDQTHPITIDDLANDKKLPAEFLRDLGLKNVAAGVIIPYRLMDGSPAPRQRLRTALVAKEGSRWDAGDGAIVPYGAWKLSEPAVAGLIIIPEGESDAWTLWYHGFPALSIPGAQMAKCLRPEHIAKIRKLFIVREPDTSGTTFVHGIQVRLREIGYTGEIFAISLEGAKDPNELHKQHTATDFIAKLNAALEAARPLKIAASSSNVWRADPMDVFLNDSLNNEVEPLYERVLYRETITEIFSPRGIGKSLFAHFLAVFLALKGFRVLLLDRDNPRKVVRERLRAWGAKENLTTLGVITREKCPPLTNAAAWSEFPYSDYDVVILDSLDSMAEGIGEQDSSKPSRAIAPILDIARRAGGPGILILGNCVRTGKHSRGSGVVEDRSDIVLEVRDCTNFHPTGKKPWIEELPAADAASWASKSSRRKGQVKFRLAFIPTKFRIGEEPEPFAMEIDTTTNPWTMADVTDCIDQEGAAERERQTQEKASAVKAAAEFLKTEILRRESDAEPTILKKQAEEFLASCGIKQKIAREVINSCSFETVDRVGKGHPKEIRLAGQNDDVNRNTTSGETAVYAGSSNGDFGRPHPERATDLARHEGQYPCGSKRGGISVDDSLLSPEGSPSFANFQDMPGLSPARGMQGTEGRIMSVLDVVSEIEAAGIALRLDGEKVRVWYPNEERRAELAEQIALLRDRRAEVVAYLRARLPVPSMPDGVRLVRWSPKPAPIALTRVEIVMDVPRFVTMTLMELKAALAGKRWLAGNRSVRELIERLDECGVSVEVNHTSQVGCE